MPSTKQQQLNNLPPQAPRDCHCCQRQLDKFLGQERCVSCGNKNRFLPSHPHFRSLQLASCDWPELSLLAMRRIQSSNQLRENNTPPPRSSRPGTLHPLHWPGWSPTGRMVLPSGNSDHLKWAGKARVQPLTTEANLLHLVRN